MRMRETDFRIVTEAEETSQSKRYLFLLVARPLLYSFCSLRRVGLPVVE